MKYGTFVRPEQGARVEVVENPVQIARAAYKLWRPRVEAGGFLGGTYATWDRPYEDAVRILAPRAREFRDASKRDLEAIISFKTWDDSPESGLFLSALHNATDLHVLDGVFSTQLMAGYRLAPGKVLIARKGSNIYDLGRHATGGTIINHGAAGSIADYATGGLYINHGNIIYFLGWAPEGGVFLNCGTMKSSLGNGASGGVCINRGRCDDIGNVANRGIQANYGIARDVGEAPEGGVQANCGTARSIGIYPDAGVQLDYGRITEENYGQRAGELHERAKPLFRRLGRLSAELETLTADPNGTLNLNEIQRLERDILALGSRIEAVCAKPGNT